MFIPFIHLFYVIYPCIVSTFGSHQLQFSNLKLIFFDGNYTQGASEIQYFQLEHRRAI